MNERTYLAVFEAPCVGEHCEVFTAKCDAAADDYAFKISESRPELVTGGYDLYRLEWSFSHKCHGLAKVDGEYWYCPIEDYIIRGDDCVGVSECV